MAKSSKRYWFDRIHADKAAMEAVGDVVAREKVMAERQKSIFGQALEQLRIELEALRKDVGDEAISRAEMQKPLTPKQLENWSKRQEQRLDSLISEFGEDEGRKIYGIQNAKRAKQDRANRVVRRQEALKQSIEVISSGAAARSAEVTKDALQNEAKQGSDSFQKQFNADAKVKFNTVSEGELKRVINTQWRGGNYSKRIWKDRDAMVKDLERAVNLGVSNGWSIQRIAKEVEHHVEVNERSAERIARTEMNRVSNAAELAYYEANGIHYYRFVATEDARTCEFCGKLDGKVFAIDEAVVGKNFPPVHPNCRCRTVGSFVDEDGKEDDKWLNELADDAKAFFEDEDDEEESIEVETNRDSDQKTSAPISQMASKTLVEDGTVFNKINHAAEYEAIKETRKQDEALDEFILGHVETEQWKEDDPMRVPRLEVLKEAQQCYSEYLENAKDKDKNLREIEFHFGLPNNVDFNNDCHDVFGDTEEYKDAGGAFGYTNGRWVLIARSTITLDGLHHEIGHAIHARYLDENETKDQELTKMVEKLLGEFRFELLPFGVDRQETPTEPPKRGFELELLKALTGKSHYRNIADYNADTANYAGIITAFHNINAIVHSDTGHGIHYGKNVDILHDHGWKELFANSVTILLSGNEEAVKFFKRHYEFIAQYVQERLV